MKGPAGLHHPQKQKHSQLVHQCGIQPYRRRSSTRVVECTAAEVMWCLRLSVCLSVCLWTLMMIRIRISPKSRSASRIIFSTFPSLRDLGVLGIKYALKKLRMNVYNMLWITNGVGGGLTFGPLLPANFTLIGRVLLVFGSLDLETNIISFERRLPCAILTKFTGFMRILN